MFTLEHIRSPNLLLAGLVVLGLTAEGVRPASGVLLTGSCPSALRPRAFSLVRLAVNLGSSVGPALGGFLAMQSYQWLFRVDGFTCMCAALPLLLMPHARLMRGEDSTREKGGKGPSVWSDHLFLMFFGMVFVCGLMFVQVWSTYPIFLKSAYGFTERDYGLLMSCNGLLIITTEMALTHYFASWRTLRVVAIGVGFFALGLGILPWGHSFGFALFSLVIWTFGEMLMAPFLATFVSNHAPARSIGSYMGLFNMAWATAFIVAPPLGAWTFEHYGSGALWHGAALMGVCGVLICLWLDRLKRAQGQ